MLPADGLAFAAYEQIGDPAAASQGSAAAEDGEGPGTSSGGGTPREEAAVARVAFGAVAAARRGEPSCVVAVCDEPLAYGKHYFEVRAPRAALGASAGAPLRLLSACGAAATRALEAARGDSEADRERRLRLAEQA